MKKPGVGICFILLLLFCPIMIYPASCFPLDTTKNKAAGLTVSLDTDTARAGSIINLTLSFNLPQGATINRPPVIKGLGGFELVDQHIYPGRISIRLFTGLPGLIKSGEISLFYLDKEGRQQALTAVPITVKVLSSLGDKPEKAQLRPIQGIIPTRSLFLKYWPWACALIVLLTAGFFLLRWYNLYKRRKLFLEYADPPHIRARKEIEELEACGLFEEEKGKEFYFRFSEIIKRYLENIRGFPAAEFTTEEIASHIDKEKDRQILPLLRHSDLVKFADDIPTAAKKKEEVTAALEYIDQTAPVYEAESHTEKAGGRDK